MLTAPSFGGSEGERRDISKEAERKNQTRICNGIKDLQFHLGNRHKGAFLRDSESHIHDTNSNMGPPKLGVLDSYGHRFSTPLSKVGGPIFYARGIQGPPSLLNQKGKSVWEVATEIHDCWWI